MDKNKMMIGGGALVVVVVALFVLLSGNSINNKLDEILDTFNSMTEVTKSIKSNDDFKAKAEDYQVLVDELSTLLDELNEFEKPDSDEEIAELVTEYYPLLVKAGDSDNQAWMDLRDIVDRPEDGHPFVKVFENLDSAFEKMEGHWFFKAIDEHETALYEEERAEELELIDECACFNSENYYNSNPFDCDEKTGFDMYELFNCADYPEDYDDPNYCIELFEKAEKLNSKCN